MKIEGARPQDRLIQTLNPRPDLRAKKRRKKRKRNELRFGENVTLTLTSIPTLQIGSIRTQKRTKSDGEEGEGVVYLAVRRGDPLPVREKKTEPGGSRPPGLG